LRCLPASRPRHTESFLTGSLTALGNEHEAQKAVEFLEIAALYKILGHPGIVLDEPIGALAHLQIGRAYAMQGDPAKALAAYHDFLILWKDADPGIPILIAAKSEYAKLQLRCRPYKRWSDVPMTWVYHFSALHKLHKLHKLRRLARNGAMGVCSAAHSIATSDFETRGSKANDRFSDYAEVPHPR
jgi:hypothetical protein